MSGQRDVVLDGFRGAKWHMVGCQLFGWKPAGE
jgi:hypothetical protein